MYNRYDRNRVERTWKQCVGKEADVDRGAANFQMNLANQCGTSGLLRLKHSHNRIEIVTEKEHKQSPDARRSLKGMNPKSMEVLAIKHLPKKPGQKWDLPEISSHDVGWMQADFVRHATHQSRTAGSGFFGGSSQAPSSGPPAGSLAAQSLAATSPTLSGTGLSALGAKQTICMVANDHILRRIQSAPHLPTGPWPDGARIGHSKGLNNVKWRRPKCATDITTYAEIYQSLLKHNPFDQAKAGR